MQNHIDSRIAKSALAKFLRETIVPGTEVHSLQTIHDVFAQEKQICEKA